MAEKNYLDFDLLIERSGKNFKARVISSPAGQASIEFTLPFSELEIENFLLKIGRPRRGVRRIESSEMEAAKVFGGRLFETVFDHDIRGCLRSSLDEAERQGSGLRIRLRTTNAPELFDLPWEYLYNPALNRFLSLSILTPIIRYFDLPERIRPLAVQHPLRVLVSISSPYDYPRLDVEQEWHNLTTSLNHLEQGGLVEIEKSEQATLTQLQRQLRRNEYHIFQFIGHGGFDKKSEDGVLVLEDEQGRGRLVSGQYLGTLLHNHRSLRLAILNACEGARTTRNDPFAGTAQSLVQQGIPAVIAMQFEITDQAAITFAQEFYSAVADGYPIDAALVEARTAIFAQGNDVEWGTPVLYLRSPDGHIFNIKQLSDEERRQARIAALHRKAQTAMAREDWQAAVIKLREVLVQDPNNAEAKVSLSLAQQEQELVDLYVQASEYYEEKRWSEALDCFQRIQDISPHYKQVDNLIATIQLKQEEQKRQENIVILLHEAQKAITKEKWNEAEAKYQEVLELEPTNAKAITGIGQVRKEKELAVLYAQAQEHHEAERWTEALECFNRVREINAQYKQVENLIAAIKQQVLEQKQQEKVIMLMSDAKEAVNAEDWQTAIEKYQAILELEPNHKKSKTGLKEAQQEQHLVELYNQGYKHYEAGEWLDALSYLGQVQKTRDDYKKVTDLIAKCEVKQKELQKISNLLSDGKNFYEKEKYQQALKTFKDIISIEHDHAESKHFIEMIQIKIKQAELVQKLFSEANSYLDAQKFSKAIETYKKILEIEPANKEATTGLKKAEKGLELKAKQPAIAKPIRTEKTRFKTFWYAVAVIFIVVGSVAGWYYFQKFKGEEKVDLSEPASIAQQQMLEAKSEAENAGAKTFMTRSYDLALSAEQKGNQAFEAGQYETANLTFLEATALFRKARDEAKALIAKEPEPSESIETNNELPVTSTPSGTSAKNNKVTPIKENLKALVGRIDVKSDPSDAQILLDGRFVGKTPYTIDNVKIGNHSLVFQKQGYREESTAVEVEQGKTHTINIELTALFGSIKVLVRPWGAIYINNALKIKEAIAPYTKQLQVGTYTVRVENPNLGTWEKAVEIKPDQERDIAINFNEEVTVTVLCPGVSAEIFVDNKTTGQWTPKEIKVHVGKHTIEVRREGFTLEGGAEVINLEENAKVEFTLRKIQ